MSSLDENTFSMWKNCNETMPCIMKKTDAVEANVKRLASIIQSKGNSNILFICTRQPGMTFEDYEETQKKYKAFTVWLLGQFFYSLGHDKFNKVYDIIIDTQIFILDQLSNSLLHIYQELSNEYKEVLKILVRYLKNSTENNLTLRVFIPQNVADLDKELNLQQLFIEITSKNQCILLLQRIMKCIKYILTENFTFYSFDEYTAEVLDNLIFLFKGSNNQLILKIVEIFVELTTKSDHIENYREQFLSLSSLFEQFVYEVYELQPFEEEDMKIFENLLYEYLSTKQDLFKNKSEIMRYIFNKCLTTEIFPNEDLKILVAKGVQESFERKLKSDIEEICKFSNSTLIHVFKLELYKSINMLELSSDFKIYNTKFDEDNIWYNIHECIIYELKAVNSIIDCQFIDCYNFFNNFTGMIMEIHLKSMKVQNRYFTINYVDEHAVLLQFLKKYLDHTGICKTITCLEGALNCLLNITILTNSRNIDILFQMIAFPLLQSHCFQNSNQFSNNFIGGEGDIKMIIRKFYKYLESQTINRLTSLKLINQLFKIMSTNLFKYNPIQLRDIENLYFKISKAVLDSLEPAELSVIIESIPYIIIIFEDPGKFINEILNPSLTSKNETVLEKSLQILPKVICCVSSDSIIATHWNQKYNYLESNVYCKKCICGYEESFSKIESSLDKETVGVKFPKLNVQSSIVYANLKHVVFALSSSSSVTLKLAALESLPVFSNHVEQFHSTGVAKLWIEMAADKCVEVRKKFAKVIGDTVRMSQENTNLPDELKIDILKVIFTTLLEHTKKSLKFSDFDLQNTLLDTIDALTNIKNDYLIMEVMKILLYLIMIPTSKYSLIAVNKCCKLAENNDKNTTIIYSQNKKDFCDVITHLCCINQALINYTLSTSLEKVSLMLGYYGSKEFVSQECNYLLPFFVAKIVKMPSVEKLIQEIGVLMDIEMPELLASKYGYIFIHIFLEEISKEDLKKCMVFLEKKANTNGAILRKQNFRIILNELLLNFHEKNRRVELALRLLSNEDIENKRSSLQDYLQPHFLGVLLYFDVKLISKNSHKDKFLLSLADLFKFMGPKHITPLRFKIIAMLQTINYENFPLLTCSVWDSFIRSCEIESLGPQLAAISVSILPLLEHCSNETNKIFSYLIVENEGHMKNYISDLFFVNNLKMNHKTLQVIKNHLKLLENSSLKEKIQKFLKYLTHENMEVRIQGMRKLKIFLEQSREELDQMILDYNGMDPSIVELIDILTSGCREKDETLIVACGEIFGELGAIEPSHMPRRYIQDNLSFSFYINEDSFIISSLNELIKAFQTENNTQSMDRYALAIQETLKFYEISPDSGSTKYYLWVQFPEPQREIMLPLLRSRYMIAQPVLADNFPSPIYGSNSGASFQSWLYNWTSSLISSLPGERKALLKVYLPSMKQDKKILMHFLPHILLHALLEGSERILENSFTEIQTITKSFTRDQILDNKVLNLRTIPIPGISSELQARTPEEVKQMQCTKAVFLLLDFLDRWVREWQWQKGIRGASDQHFQKIKLFLAQLCKLELAKCNYHSGEFPRALMYLEAYIMENEDQLSNNLSFFAEIYAQLEEPDGVDGAMALQQVDPSIEQKILALEVSGKLADATNCYERLLQPLKLSHIQGLTQCYLDLDNVNTALNFVRGAFDNDPKFGNMLLEMQAEPLWRLGQYDELNTLLDKPELVENKSWGVQMGKALLHMKNGERDGFQRTLNDIRKQQIFSFAATSLEEGAYECGYGYISKLHALNELQQVEKVLSDLLLNPNNREYAENTMKKLLTEWSLRMKVVQESVRIIEPLLCLRRVSLNLAKSIAEERVQNSVPYLNSLIGECWLLSAKTARSAGMHQQAYTYTLKAEEYSPPTLFLEKAKLHWLREEHEQALHSLRRGLEVILPEGNSLDMLTIEQRKICAEAKLLIASYNDEISNVDIEVTRQNYKESVEMFKEWEKSLVYLAQYLDKIFQTFNDSEKDSRCSDLQQQMINYFGKSLLYGTNYVYQSMPRLLSIWFDYGTRLLDISQSSIKEERKNILLRMTKLIDFFLEKLPAYVFLTAFSQLVSRICHPQKEVYIMLKSIIIKLVQQYPQQSLWMIISVIKSSYSVRSKKCAEILCDPRLKTASLIKLIKDFTTLAEKLIELCNKEIPKDMSTASVNNMLRTLPRLLTKQDFSEIMMPTFKLRKLILPNPDFNNGQHNPFPNAYIYIVGIEDELNVLPSLQKPRKITLNGSDGKKYIYMLKPKDDLRKDFRLMEFNDIVNHLLTREGEARQRRLNIRLYSVAPLNEECGLIEWVPNLVGLRPVLASLYKQRGCSMNQRVLRETGCNIKDSLEKKRDVFLKKLLPCHPAVLGEWFRRTFPDAQTWLTARTAYVRTTAVMSMAGYILGLGDRHGENIQLDSTCGDVVHVDFNCLFNKGEKFDWPERVPFRLTHNMVSAMGPLGVEGLFRKSCACTLRVLRDNTNTLMSIVAPFVYDPLVSWPRHQSSLPSVHNAERTNEEAVDHIKNIELRLQGTVKSRNRPVTLPLSVEGQTNYLIKEAVSIDNLCQMYIGWGAYL